MGGSSKPAVELAGRPLLHYPLVALGAVCGSVAVVCKPHTELSPLPDEVERWEEPAEPHHPLTGLVYALERAAAPILVCAADMPFVTPEALRALEGRGEGAAAVVARAGGRLQPLLALYTPAALPVLRAAEPDAPLTATVERLRPVVVEVPARDAVSVDTPEALERAEAVLSV
jgi:molybdopterin-guanine dinucleotide biosynthesis protein A